MSRRTSADSYRVIKDNGLLSKRRFQVYQALFHDGPLTAVEVWKRCSDAQLNSISPRMAELRTLGVVREVGERHCTVTGMTAIIWDVTEKLPMAVQKNPTRPCPFCRGKGKVEVKERQRGVRPMERLFTGGA